MKPFVTALISAFIAANGASELLQDDFFSFSPIDLFIVVLVGVGLYFTYRNSRKG